MKREISRFLKDQLHVERWDPVQGDASTRRFWRVHPADASSQILMEYPEPWTGENLDAVLTQIFQQAGLAVPAIYRVEPELGILLLEDLGDRTLEQELVGADLDSAPPTVLVEAATLAARIGTQGTPVLERSHRGEGPALDSGRFRFEMDYFLEHFVGGYLGGRDSNDGLRDALYALADRAAVSSQRVLCHRDFHSRNLMIAPDGRLTMVDIQDARWGPDTYDIASLIYDAYASIPGSWRGSLIAAFATAARIEDDDSFRDRLHVVSIQRMIKALGTFGFQIAARSNPRYEPSAERTCTALRELLPIRAATSDLAIRFETGGLLDPPKGSGANPEPVEP